MLTVMKREFWPEDTDTAIYIAGDCKLSEIQSRIAQKWPGVNADDISIEPDYIHTDCLGYDLFDACDYTNFLVIRLTK